MVYDAVIFDLDGTLVYTLPEYRYEVVGKTLKTCNAAGSKKDIDRFWFEGDRDKIIRECFGCDPKVFWEAFRKYDCADLRKSYTRTYDDVGFIQDLKKKGFKVGVVTGALPHIVAINLEVLGRENFDAVIVAFHRNGIRPKPDPHGLQECLKMLDVSAGKAVFVGNGDEDVLCGKAANVFDVLIDRGDHRNPDIKPSRIIKSLCELENIF